MTYKFSQRSLDRMKGVHGDLVKVMLEAIKESPYDFGITEGVRTPQRQQELYAAGKSRTLNSRHLKGLAVDIAIFVDGKLTWEFKYYEEVAKHVLKVCAEMGIPVVWGGAWRGFVDAVHFELDRKVYQ
jgi:peptidoglycan L-alanyl-D-glutamate endopeptidase CwlK